MLFDNDLPIVGNNFGVNYGDEQITIYDVKVSYSNSYKNTYFL